MSDSTKSLIKSTMTLGLAGIIVKIVGAFFRVALTNLIHFEGMSYYGKAFPVYSALLVISTIGLPIAISKMVSERVTENNYRGAYHVFRVAWRFLLAVGIITSILMFFLAGPITQNQALPKAVYSLMAIAPSLFFVSLMSAYRGYFQGLQNMRPTAVSQIIEQLVKFVAGMLLALLFMQLTGKPELGSMGALIGITVSEATALFYVRNAYGKQKKEMLLQLTQTGGSVRVPLADAKSILKKLLVIAVPVTIGALIFPLVTLLDSIIIPNGLAALGYSTAQVSSMFGVLSGGVVTLINMTAVLSQAVQMSIVPSISQAQKLGDRARVKSNASNGIRFAFMEGIPVMAVFLIFARPIIQLLYGTATVSEIDLATNLLMMLSCVALFLPLVQTTNGALQGVGKQKLPPISLAIGTGIKAIISITLVQIPQINIYAAAIGTFVCYTVTTILNCIFVYRYTGARIGFIGHLGKPLLCTLLMSATAYLAYFLLGRYSNTVGILAAAVIGIIVYLVALVRTKAISERELSHMPAGKKIVRILKKTHILAA